MSTARPAVSEHDLLAYSDGQLDSGRAAEVAAWLAERPEEQARVDAFRQQTALLKATLDPTLAEPVPPQLVAALSRRRRRLLPVAAAIAATAAVAFPAGLTAGLLLARAPAPTEMERLAETGLSAHRLYTVEVRHPVEVGADQEQHLVNWLTKRIDAPVKAPDLSAEGLSLIGGRLVLAGAGKPGALLMYEGSTGQRFTLFIERTATGAMTAFRYAEEGSVAAFYWIDGPAGYVLTGPADRDRLLRIAEAIYDQLD